MKKTSAILSAIVLIGSTISPVAMASDILGKPFASVSSMKNVATLSVHDLDKGDYVIEKIMAKDQQKKKLELEKQGVVTLADQMKVYQLSGNDVVEKSLSNVLVGAENARVYLDNSNQVKMIMLEGETPSDKMRVGIYNNSYGSLDHQQVSMKSPGGLVLINKKTDEKFQVNENQQVTFLRENDGMKVTVDNQPLVTTKDRLQVMPADHHSLIQIPSLKRSQGVPQYRGVFEISPSVTPGKLSVINEIHIEQYLYQVVPSEMPASFGLEALKAQSIAARTYALSDYYSNRYAPKGFHVDDSTLSQVYNNTGENQLVNQAVDATRGLVMKNGTGLVDARYYSSSAGLGVGRHENTSDPVTQMFPGTPVDYLPSQSFLMESQQKAGFISRAFHSEEEVLSFLKDLSVVSVDSQSVFFRWKVEMSKQELQNTINKNLAARAAADPNAITKLDVDGQYKKSVIPPNGVGELNTIAVAKRGTSGNIMELVIEGSNGTFKVSEDYNIRNLLRPSKTYTGGQDVILHRAKGGSSDYIAGQAVKNYSLLPSGFAAFDYQYDSNGQLASLTIYGGGNGHGMGMSQYGAATLGALGLPVEQILQTFYPNHQLENIYQY
ncbi:SpoIID/LytB domain-containing protein [Brevibacillus daliensis]|uniref:SpoIID/LytB domain-containing protein n=1 Tax=Brevibacillus daliensis TaxID=2892995 RepID=UPI001E2DD807|nr:SpoIID/LytB domain-containing protein [Brevibacillus daliensis]